MKQRCIGCDARYPLPQVIYTCPACGDVLEIELDAAQLKGPRFERLGVWRYAPLLPVSPEAGVTLGEGATGLHRCGRLGAALGINALYVKNEGENPTGSFKDRGMTVGVAQACTLGARVVACASTGNTAASMAAYAARAGLTPIVLLPAGKVALGKVAQAVIHGARLVQINGNFDDAMRLVTELATQGASEPRSLTSGSPSEPRPQGSGSAPESRPSSQPLPHGRGSVADAPAVYLLNSINPFRLEGQKTLAYEVCEALGDAPDTVVLPLGNAGNISAIWKGFREFHAAGLITKLPRMIGVQAAGAAPVARFLRGELGTCRVDDPQTIATAIRIGAPVSWKKAVTAIRDSGGSAEMVTDEEILAAQQRLAREEGLFVEPSSAAPVAWLLREFGTPGPTARAAGSDQIPTARAAGSGQSRSRKQSDARALGTVVCVTTGHGLKDPDAVLRAAPQLIQVDATLAALQAALAKEAK